MAEQIGIQLVHLELVCLRESLDLTQVAHQCPNIQILEIYYSMAVHVSSPDNFQFKNLQKLIIYSTDVVGPNAQKVSNASSIHFLSRTKFSLSGQKNFS